MKLIKCLVLGLAVAASADVAGAKAVSEQSTLKSIAVTRHGGTKATLRRVAGKNAVVGHAAAREHAVTKGHTVSKQSPSHLIRQLNQGPLDADLNKDASMRMITNEVRDHAEHPQETNAHLDHLDVKGRAIQAEVESMVGRMKELHDDALMSQFAEELEGVEEAEEAQAEKAGDEAMVEEVDQMRAELCLDEGMKAHRLLDCEGFMRKACVPDNVTHLARVSKENCTTFFQQEVEQKAVSNSTLPLTGSLFDVLKAISARKDLAASLGATSGPAPAPAPGPGGPGPAILGGKFANSIDRELPEHGYDGRLVMHVDKETMITNWQKEFGPNSGARSFISICADHPDNEWCRLHGYYPGEETAVAKRSLKGSVRTSDHKDCPNCPKPSRRSGDSKDSKDSGRNIFDRVRDEMRSGACAFGVSSALFVATVLGMP